MRLYTLPNKMEIAYQSRAEVAFFYADMFEKEVYLQHGITIRDGDCVFDVGANIGFFTLFVHSKCRPSAVYAFEPAPPLFDILRYNAARYAPQARLFNCGLSSERTQATFTFYPNSSGMSSFYGDPAEEKAALRMIMVNQWRHGMSEMRDVFEHADDLLEERFRSQTYECQLRTLSEVIRAQQVERIDLLKIDVQKSELGVLQGIEDADWGKIQQVVLEVHDIEDRCRVVREMLEQRGFELVIRQDEMYADSTLYNFYARRSQARRLTGQDVQRAAMTRTLEQVQGRAQKQNDALQRQWELRQQRRKKQ